MNQSISAWHLSLRSVPKPMLVDSLVNIHKGLLPSPPPSPIKCNWYWPFFHTQRRYAATNNNSNTKNKNNEKRTLQLKNEKKKTVLLTFADHRIALVASGDLVLVTSDKITKRRILVLNWKTFLPSRLFLLQRSSIATVLRPDAAQAE